VALTPGAVRKLDGAVFSEDLAAEEHEAKISVTRAK
jgi:hypothetical protein